MVRTMREEPGGGPPPNGTFPGGDAENISLKDGTALHLRPIRAEDEAGLLALYDRLSAESLHFRFFAVPEKDAGKAAYLSHVDYDRRYAIVAERAGALVGVARWERLAERPGHAEVAFTVADDFQGRGLGGILFRRLAALARARGITVFEAEVLENNERMRRVFESTGLATETRGQGNVLTILLTLGPPSGTPA